MHFRMKQNSSTNFTTNDSTTNAKANYQKDIDFDNIPPLGRYFHDRSMSPQEFTNSLEKDDLKPTLVDAITIIEQSFARLVMLERHQSQVKKNNFMLYVMLILVNLLNLIRVFIGIIK